MIKYRERLDFLKLTYVNLLNLRNDESTEEMIDILTFYYGK